MNRKDIADLAYLISCCAITFGLLILMFSSGCAAPLEPVPGVADGGVAIVGLIVPEGVWVSEQAAASSYCEGRGMRLGTTLEIAHACQTRFTNQGGFQFQCAASNGYADSLGQEFVGEYPAGLVSRPVCVSNGL